MKRVADKTVNMEFAAFLKAASLSLLRSGLICEETDKTVPATNSNAKGGKSKEEMRADVSIKELLQ